MRCGHAHGMTPHPGKTSRYRSVFSMLIEFEAVFDSFFEISRLFDSIFNSNEILDSSVPYFMFRQIGDSVHFLFCQTVQKLVYGEW